MDVLRGIGVLASVVRGTCADEYVTNRCRAVWRVFTSFAPIAIFQGATAGYQCWRDGIAWASFPFTSTFAAFLVVTWWAIAVLATSIAVADSSSGAREAGWRRAYAQADERDAESILSTRMQLSRLVWFIAFALVPAVMLIVQVSGLETVVLHGTRQPDPRSWQLMLIACAVDMTGIPIVLLLAVRAHRKLVAELPDAAKLPWPWLLR